MLRHSITIATTLVLTGCMFNDPEQPLVQVSAPDRQSTSLEQLAADAVKAQLVLAELRNLGKPRHDTVYKYPPELNRMISAGSFAGPLKVITADVAREAGYITREVGSPKSVIVVVEWTEPLTIAEALTDLGVRAGVAADIEVDPNIGKVSIIYD